MLLSRPSILFYTLFVLSLLLSFRYGIPTTVSCSLYTCKVPKTNKLIVCNLFLVFEGNDEESKPLSGGCLTPFIFLFLYVFFLIFFDWKNIKLIFYSIFFIVLYIDIKKLF